MAIELSKLVQEICTKKVGLPLKRSFYTNVQKEAKVLFPFTLGRTN